jgi:hypothetical protein
VGSCAGPYEDVSTRAVLDLRGLPAPGRPTSQLVLRPERGAPAVGADVGAAGDHALRCEIVLALLGRLPAGPVLGLLTRSGDLEWHREDAGWDAAVTAALGEADRRGRLVVVTHAGWAEPRTGLVRRLPCHDGAGGRS